jgi:hypothetical protein
MGVLAVISEGYHVIPLANDAVKRVTRQLERCIRIYDEGNMCQYEGYVNCFHPWDVLHGASNPSDLHAAKKGAHRT